MVNAKVVENAKAPRGAAKILKIAPWKRGGRNANYRLVLEPIFESLHINFQII